jgi:predicted RNA-binding Zn ribbon-like protein
MRLGGTTDKPHIGGRLCLDFVNAFEEWGASYAALVAWAERVGLLAPQQAEHLAARDTGDPTVLRALKQAVTLRHTLYQVFSAAATGRPPAPRALAALNESLAHALGKLRLVATPRGGITWAWGGDPNAPDGLLWPIVHDAADLLTGAQRERVRECAAADCDQLFVDRSRNRSRRWCEMAHCGMLAKSRRHYARTRTARAGTEDVVGAGLPTGRSRRREEVR